MPDLSNTLAVVFGGGRDIGGAISIALAQRGANIALSYNSSNPTAVIEAIEAAGRTPFVRQVDAYDTTAVRAFAHAAQKHFGNPINILVNVVGGILARKKMEDMDDTFWDQVFDLNVKSIFAMTQATLPLMSDSGTIVNVSSQAGRDGGGGGAIAYGATKGAIMSMTRGLAKELGPRRIRVNAVCPGMISTKFHDDFTAPAIREKVAGATPLGREGKATEVADLVVYLASPQSSFVNGTCVDINGGTLFS
jgi:3-oxoacyl-[acyl-carrier protein] reductase